MLRSLLVVALLAQAACAGPAAAPDPFADMRRTTYTFEAFTANAAAGDPPSRGFVVEPGGRARAHWRTSRGRVQERSFTLAAPGYETFMLAVARAIYAEARPVRPDAIRPPESSVARLTIERDALQMRIEGPLQALWRVELAAVSLAFWNAAIPRPDYAALLPDEALAEQWPKQWRVAVTPVIPGRWPLPERGGTLVRYVYAYRTDWPSLRATEYAAPFARSIENADGSGRIETIGPFRVAALVGVRPLSAEQVALRNREFEVADLLLEPLDRADEPLVREFTCHWLLYMGTARDEILARHADFVTWLRCPWAVN